MRWTRQVVVLLLVIFALVGGLAAGVHWHASVDKVLGFNKKTKHKQLWWDPMVGPSSIRDKPGVSSMGMKLIPYNPNKQKGAAAGEVIIDPAIQQDMGVQTALVHRTNLSRTIHTVGYVRVPPGRIASINLKISGWVQKLYATYDGQMVAKGQKLFTLYSPQLVVAEQELLGARRNLQSLGAGADKSLKRQAASLLKIARQRLRYWSISRAQINHLLTTGRVTEAIAFTSPISGEVMDKRVVQGSAVMAGKTVMRIANHQVVWIDAQVYSYQLPWVAAGQNVVARVDGVPSRTFTGRVIFIAHSMNPKTRTVDVRLQVSNRRMALKPGMYAHVAIATAPLKNVLVAPRAAILETGTKNIVFVAQKQGHFLPVSVRIGRSGGHNLVQITKGLKAGQQVVTSGQFLLDVESRTQEAFADYKQPSGK